MDIREFKDKLFEAARQSGISDIELFYSSGSSESVYVYNGNVEKFNSSSCGGIGARGLYNGVMGYYYSEVTDEKDIPLIIDALIQNAGITDSGDEEFIFEGSDKYEALSLYNDELDAFTVEDKIAAALKMEKTALEYDSRIKSVTGSQVVSGRSEKYIANSKGLELSEKSNYIMAYIELIAEENGSTKEMGEIWAGTSAANLEPADIAAKAAERALRALGGSPVGSGSKNIILENRVFADILECFSGSFFAENVQKGFSMLKGRLGEIIASDKVSIADDPLLEDGFNSTAFDSEGVASYNKTVVDHGVLKTYLYNLKSAHKDGVSSTGNGFKGSFKGRVSTDTTNFYLKAGSLSPEQLLERLGDGLFITSVAGLHSGANGITGDFSLAADGFLVEKGSIIRPVEQITIASNFFELLKNVEETADDLYFSVSGVGSPSVIVKNISVSGL